MCYNKSGDSMKNNGFTLIELMATVAIIALLAVLITPLVNNMINDANQRAYSSVVDTIEDAAKSYTSLNSTSVDSSITANGYADITIETLKESDLLDNKIMNPLTKSQISNTDVVRITKSSDKYIYEYIGG